MGIINTKEQLENAIEKGENNVLVFGDFANMIISLKLAEKIAWIVAIISLSTSILKRRQQA